MGMLIDIYTENRDGLEEYYNALKGAGFYGGPLGLLCSPFKYSVTDEGSLIGTEPSGKGVRYYISVKTGFGNEVTTENVGEAAKKAIVLALENIKPIKALDSLGKEFDLEQFKEIALDNLMKKVEKLS